MSEAVFERRDGGYEPSGHARGPWDPGAMHGGAPAALLAGVMERLDPGSDMVVARITFEFLGPVPLTTVAPRAEVVRAGRRFQVLEGELSAGGRPVLRARAVRLRRGALALPQSALAGDGLPCEGPQDSGVSVVEPGGEGEGFARAAMDIRFAGGTDFGPGRALAWFSLARPLVAGEPPSPLQRVVAAADFGNGVGRALHWDEHLFVNTDLTVHLHREAAGPWVLLDAGTVVDPTGVGLATTRLYDERGPLGVGAQTLFVDVR